MAWKSQSIRSARPSVPSSELGPTTPSSASECVSPLGPGGSNTRLREEGVGGPNSDEGTGTLVIYVYPNPFTVVALGHCPLNKFKCLIVWATLCRSPLARRHIPPQVLCTERGQWHLIYTSCISSYVVKKNPREKPKQCMREYHWI
jgi:hypothetical protein